VLRVATLECCACFGCNPSSGEWAIVEHLKQEYVLMPAKGACAALVVCQPGRTLRIMLARACVQQVARKLTELVVCS
jgi:hypothetical protein